MLPTGNYARELRVVMDAVAHASQAVLEVYARGFTVDWKGHNDPVTAADQQANECLVSAIQKAFPEDGICAEEAHTEWSLAQARRGGRCWFIDPLDGTKEFIARNGEFCVMVGLALDGLPVFGLVHAPTTATTTWGVVGEGAWECTEDGAPRALRAHPSSARERIALGSRSHQDPLVADITRELGIGQLVPTGSVGLKVAKLARNEADLYLHLGRGPKLWDGCAPDAIARSAGLCVSDRDGRALDYSGQSLWLGRGLVVALPTLHQRAIEALRGRAIG